MSAVATYAETLTSRAAAYFHAGDVDRAVAAIDEVLREKPDDPRALYYRALGFQSVWDMPNTCTHMQRTGLAPGLDADRVPFEQFCQRNMEFVGLRDAALRRGMPAIQLVAMPRSASAWVSNFTSRALAVPSCRISTGGATRSIVVPNWAKEFAKGGALTHEHYGATPHNIATLVEHGLTRVSVQLRDPRQALLSMSMLHFTGATRPPGKSTTAFNRNFAALPLAERIEQSVREEYGLLVDWVASWVAAAESAALQVRFVTYEEFVRDQVRFLRDLWAFFGLTVGEQQLAQAVAAAADDRTAWTNFRQGSTEEWRRLMPPAVQDLAWRMTPPALAERFGWQR